MANATPLRATVYGLPVVPLTVTVTLLSTTNYPLPITNYQLPITHSITHYHNDTTGASQI
ncbi:alpha/beta hydrolase [Mastigocoleus testarum]|uniref:alpha/beta hydrolase n=1 Tax=Mastigocoleus testarum TaxID=996925 RepID=UPI000A8A8BD9|nr:alpha/beta hydrolase [Mastigocoleus testarum]